MIPSDEGRKLHYEVSTMLYHRRPESVNFYAKSSTTITERGNLRKGAYALSTEPNGYLHIGHAKSICAEFRTWHVITAASVICASDDTNPTKEEQNMSIRSLPMCAGSLDWEDRLFYASDYFDSVVRVGDSLDQRWQSLRR